MHDPRLSIVVPLFNEEDNVAELCDGIAAAMRQAAILEANYEVLLVDDGSTDRTVARIREILPRLPAFHLVSFTRNFGQTAAISAGFNLARGAIVVPMDGDLQNDPTDIPRLLAKLEEGYDVVSGWRKKRRDGFLLRRLPSMTANWLISWVSGVHLHDYGCTLKAYRAEFTRNVRLYGEMHRFIPIYAHWDGARITEMPVLHHPRKAGQSKYGLIRTFKVVLDLITIKFMSDFSQKPIYFFGSFGFAAFAFAFLVGVKTLYERFVLDIPGINLMPLVLLTMLLILSGMIAFFVGILSEILLRIHYEVRNDRTYRIRETVGGASTTTGAVVETNR